MKPRHVIEATITCDFSHAGLDDGLDALNKYIYDNDIKTIGNTYLYVGLECDLLRVIDLSRTYSMWPSFKAGYKPCEWSIHKLRKDYSHIVYHSPGA